MANQLYSTAAVYLEDLQLSESASVSIKVNGNHQIVKTLAKGVSGISKGAVQTDINVVCNIPADGFELDVLPFINQTQEVNLTVFLASSTLTLKGFIMNSSVDKAVDGEAKLSFDFVGGEGSWD